MQEVTALGVVFLIGAGLVLSVPGVIHSSEAAEQTSSMVGGPCEYRDYPGEAEVLSVARIGGKQDRRPDEYEVKCRFHPRRPIEEPFAQVSAREFRLLVENDENPGQRFIDKHDLKVGKRIPCVLRAIVQGTCTPILYEFPWTHSRGK